MPVPAGALPDQSRARATLLLTAPGQTRPSLGAALLELAGAASVALDPAIEVRVLTGIADDPFPDVNPGVAPMDVVLELDGPAEVLDVDRAASFLGSLVAAVEPLIDAGASGAVFGWPQQIIGGPHSALRYLYLMRRRSDLSHDAYLDHYFHHHSSYAFHLTGIRAYTQVHVDPEATARLARAVGLDDLGLDSITELSIDSVDAFLAGVTPEAAEASTDELRFVDRDRSVSFCATDRPATEP